MKFLATKRNVASLTAEKLTVKARNALQGLTPAVLARVALQMTALVMATERKEGPALNKAASASMRQAQKIY